jgi:hypothetical protein
VNRTFPQIAPLPVAGITFALAFIGISTGVYRYLDKTMASDPRQSAMTKIQANAWLRVAEAACYLSIPIYGTLLVFIR